jgi:hypothetical protein
VKVEEATIIEPRSRERTSNADDVLAPYRRDGHAKRDHRRTPEEVPWLSTVKLPWGLEVFLLNISSTGMLIETSAKFTPGSLTEFELQGPGTSLVIPGRFVRTEVALVDSHGVKYRAAAAFGRELRFPDLALHVASRSTPMALANLLTDVLADASAEGHPLALRARFERGLRELVRARDVQIREAALTRGDATESICFTVPSAVRQPKLLQVTTDPGHELAEGDLRLLKAAAAMAAVLLEFEKWPEAAGGV